MVDRDLSRSQGLDAQRQPRDNRIRQWHGLSPAHQVVCLECLRVLAGKVNVQDQMPFSIDYADLSVCCGWDVILCIMHEYVQ